jgi:Ras of Complex, Roc, domain of DAPkinase
MELCRACCRRLCCLKAQATQEVEHADDAAATSLSAQSANPQSAMRTSNQSIDKLVRIVIVGETRVGKTSLMRRYLNGYFDGAAGLDEPHSATLGVDFGCKNVDIGEGRVRVQGQLMRTCKSSALWCLLRRLAV